MGKDDFSVGAYKILANISVIGILGYDSKGALSNIYEANKKAVR